MIHNSEISPLWWLWGPIVLIAAQLALEFTLPSDFLAALLSENGPHEMLQFAFMTAAFIVAIWILASFKWRERPWLAGWVGIAALGALYVAGEELSWGQHVLEWGTPEFWAQVNDQGETNLHNTSSWLDQKPRLILEIGVIVGGLLIPLLMKYAPQVLPQQFKLIYPPATLAVSAFVVLAVTVADKIGDVLPDAKIFERASEIEELYMFYFVLLYLIVLRFRVVQQKA